MDPLSLVPMRNSLKIPIYASSDWIGTEEEATVETLLSGKPQDSLYLTWMQLILSRIVSLKRLSLISRIPVLQRYQEL